MDTVTIYKGDYGYALSYTCQDNAGTAFSLSGYTAYLVVWEPDDSNAHLTGTCTTDVAASGTCHYDVVSGNFDTEFKYMAKIRVEKASTKISFEPFWLDVKESI